MTESGRRPPVVLDAVGVLLLLLYVGATLVAARKGGDPGPEVALILGAAVALVAGRLLGLVHRAIVPAAVAAMGAVALVASGPVIGGGPLDGPFGYRNATGAFFVLATIAALMVAASVPRRWMRVLAILAAVPFAFVAASDSAAAGVSLLVIVVALIGLFGSRGVRVSIVAVATCSPWSSRLRWS